MKKLFFNEDYDENFHTIDYFKEILTTHNLESIVLHKGKVEYGTDYFYCAEAMEVGMKDDPGCGRDCEWYEPCNGKSGRCRHNKNCYTETGEIFKLTKDGKLIKEDL
jgi:hypothetical protein